MNEKEFARELGIIAEEETPEALNLWENIKMELHEDKQKKQKRAPSRYKWLRYAAAFVICLGLGIAGYVYYQAQTPDYPPSYGDTTLPESLVSNLALSQTVEGVTVTIDWAYADSHRAAIGITTSYMSNVPFDPYCATCTSKMSVQTADGQEILPAFGGGGGGGGGGPVEGPYLISTSSSSSYDTSGLVVTGDTLDLVITFDYDPLGQTNAAMGGNGGTGGGGGGGGGGGNSDGVEPTAVLDPMRIPPRSYRFEFSIPFYRAESGRLDATSFDSNDVQFEISNLAISPSMSEFDLCYSLPTAEEWYPSVLFYTGSEAAIYEQQMIAPLVDLDGRTVYAAFPKTAENYLPMLSFDYEAMQACGNFIVQAPYEGGNIDIMIPHLYLNSFAGFMMDEARIQPEQDYYENMGIEFIYSIISSTEDGKAGQQGTFVFPVSDNPDDGYYLFAITKHPDGMTAEEAIQYLMYNWMRVRHDVNLSFPVYMEN